MNAIAIDNAQVQEKNAQKTSIIDRFIRLFEAPEAYAAGVMAMYGSYSNPVAK